jgi:hypothetical protein
MHFPLFIAEGAGANQGALILVGLLLPFIAVGLGIRARLKKKLSVVGIVVAVLALVPSTFVLHIFGLPWARDYWGAYIPLLPLVLSLLGLALSIQKRPIQSPQTTTGSSAPDRV